MVKSATEDKISVTITTDKKTRDEFSKLCDTLGLSMSSATNALIKQAVRTQKIELSAVDENGFTPDQIKELSRRFSEIRNGNYEEHNLIEE